MSAAAAKDELRAALTSARKAMSDVARAAARDAVRDLVLARARDERWSCVAAYEPLRTEPGSFELLTGLAALGARVVVPVTLPDRDLDWVGWPHSQQRDGDGPLHPQALGRDAIAQAAAIVVPALAVARDGTRLGRGGGSYDRALRRCSSGTPRVALLFDHELVPELPRDEWDEPVSSVVSPAGWTDLGMSVTA